MFTKLLIVGLSISFCYTAILKNKCNETNDCHESANLIEWIDGLLLKRTIIEQDNSNSINQTVCMVANKCFSKYLIRMRCGMSLKMVKTAKCPCSGAFSYQCGKFHCSADSIACDKLNEEKKKLKLKENKEVNGISECAIDGIDGAYDFKQK